MKLHTINTGYFKLDGGAMFGVVPKSIWNKINPADENNMSNWALRSLLIQDGDRLILVDNGIGDKQDEKFFSYYFWHGDETLNNSFAKNISVRFVDGHTDAMMLPEINYNGKTVVYMADLLPSAGHIPIPYVMAYDMFPLTTLNEKRSFLNEAVKGEYILFFEHDPL